MRIKTDIKINNNRPDLFVFDKKKNLITLIEVGITSQENLTLVENEKSRKYDILTNELALLYKCKTRIIPYVMTWDGLVTKFHKKYLHDLKISAEIEAYMQFVELRKTLELISLEKRRGLEESELDDVVERSIGKLCSDQDVFDGGKL